MVATISGQIVTRTGRYREQIWGAWFFMTLSTGLMIALDDRSNLYADPFPSSITCILSVSIPPGLSRSSSCSLAPLEPAPCSR